MDVINITKKEKVTDNSEGQICIQGRMRDGQPGKHSMNLHINLFIYLIYLFILKALFLSPGDKILGS